MPHFSPENLPGENTTYRGCGVKGIIAAILDEMGVELRPEPGIYLHLTAPIDGGYRVIEVWDHREGFEAFMQARMAPAAAAIGLNREMKVTIEPLYNIFAPRLDELPPLVEDAFLRPNAHIPA